MERTFELFGVKMIKFNNYSEDIRIIGTYFMSNLSYETELRIGQSNLNQLINELQKLNPELEVSETLQTEVLPGGEIYYSINAEEMNNKLAFSALVGDSIYKQIRA